MISASTAATGTRGKWKNGSWSSRCGRQLAVTLVLVEAAESYALNSW